MPTNQRAQEALGAGANSRGILLVAPAPAALFRLFQPTSNPAELFEDEVSGAASCRR